MDENRFEDNISCRSITFRCKRTKKYAVATESKHLQGLKVVNLWSVRHTDMSRRSRIATAVMQGSIKCFH